MSETTISVNLVGVGGNPPYTFSVVQDSGTTVPATISGSTLTVDTSAVAPGAYSVHVQVTDQATHTFSSLIPINAASSNNLAILTDDYSFQPTTFPQAVSLPLTVVGGVAPYTWSLIPSVTTLPGVSISGSELNFSATTFGQWTVGLRVTDSLSNTTTRLILVGVVTADVVSLTDGQVELDLTPTTQEVGTHTFTLTVADSGQSVPVTRSFSYSVANEISEVDVVEASVDHIWTTNDATSVVYPIAGDLSGFTVGTEGTVIADNGINVSIDTVNNAMIVTGPPTSFQNAEVDVQIAILQNNTQVAIVTREFTLIAHNSTTDLGTMTCNTRSYITGELVGLNPLRPFFNSPLFYKNQGYTVQLATGSSLPLGLSLDANTGQIYGTVLAANVATSALNYVDSTGNVHGTVTIQWDICASQFPMIDETTPGQVQVAYSANIGTTSSSPLTAVTIHSGRLPIGLAASIAAGGGSVVISGTPSEAGYFDVWFRITNANGQVAYVYTRFVVNYIAPLVIVTEVFERLLTNVAFNQTLQAFGGITPYTWSLVSGTLPTGLTLNAASGIVSGTTSMTTYNQNLTIGVTDARGVTTTAVLNLTINNTLTITTAVLPLVTPGQNYQFQMQAEGGTAPYTWSLGTGSPALPGGFGISSTGLITGATSLQNYNQNVVIQVTDSASNAVTKAFNLLIGSASGLTIDTEGVGPITRGEPYQGLVAVLGPGVAPYQWTVTPDSPNALPTGLTFTPSQANSGATAILAGEVTADLLNYAVKLQVVDSNGNFAFGYLFLNSFSGLAITTTSLPQATVGGSYSVQLQSNSSDGANWSLDPSSNALPTGLTLTVSGVLSGVPSQQGTTNITFRVTDAAADYATAVLPLAVVQSTLAITSSSLAQATSGIAYNQSLTASGGTTPYTWIISPNSSNGLPSGLSLSSSGQITGTTLASGFSKAITFRVTDAIGVYREATFTLSVVAGLTLTAGPDYVNGTNTNVLGIGYTAVEDVTSISPRPNLSFFIVATNVISLSASGLSFGLPPGFTASVASLANGTAMIALSGPFYASSAGNNTLNVTVIDSGVSVSKSFTWVAAPQANIRITPVTGSMPVLVSN